MATNLSLLVGLGNPTSQYAATRHNAGFWLLDRIAHRQGVAFRVEPRFHGWLGRLEAKGSNLFLLKPATYMNRSGQSVAGLANYFKIMPGEILVAHDDLDLAPGVVRLKRGGGHGGHNGLRDIIGCLGTADFWRLRFGIGHPGDRRAVVDYVLHAPLATERELIDGAMSEVDHVFPDLVLGRTEEVMKRLNSMRPPMEKTA